MFKEILESIKGPRKFSMNHWRYKLLHWSFAINPANAGESSLPKFLYTHYCPLFHLTNILLLASPFILTARIVIYLSKFLSIPTSYVFGFLDYTIKNVKVYSVPQKSDKEKELSYIYQTINRKLRQYQYDFTFVTVGLLYKRCSPQFHTEEEFTSIVTAYLDKVKVAFAKKESRRKEYEAQMVFWINLSRTLMKFVYVTVGLLAVYGTFVYVLPCILWFICAMLTVNWWAVLTLTLQVLITIGIIAIPAFTFAYIMAKLEDNVIIDSIRHFLAETFSGLGVLLRECYDFVAILYENNCPPIEIVSGSDEEALSELDV